VNTLIDQWHQVRDWHDQLSIVGRYFFLAVVMLTIDLIVLVFGWGEFEEALKKYPAVRQLPPLVIALFIVGTLIVRALLWPLKVLVELWRFAGWITDKIFPRKGDDEQEEE
jgi:hypothetical protein